MLHLSEHIWSDIYYIRLYRHRTILLWVELLNINQMIDKMLNLVWTWSIQLWWRINTVHPERIQMNYLQFWIPVVLFYIKLCVVLMYRYRSIEKQPSDGDSNIEYPIRVLWMLEECQSFRRPTCWPRGVRLALWFTQPLGWRQAVNSVPGEAKTLSIYSHLLKTIKCPSLTLFGPYSHSWRLCRVWVTNGCVCVFIHLEMKTKNWSSESLAQLTQNIHQRFRTDDILYSTRFLMKLLQRTILCFMDI